MTFLYFYKRNGNMIKEMKDILQRVDHTLLKQTATWDEIKMLCDEGMEYQVASVCIPPCYVKVAKEYVKNQLPICTVIGFPNGNMTLESKVYETKQAIEDGADEIDMVINIGYVKDKKYQDIQREIEEVKKACGHKVLKVIIETCLLTEEEKIKMCQVVTKAKADYIKTSTGFSTGGATKADIKLMKDNIGKEIKIKAAGGISSIEDAEDFIKLGANRLGTSRMIALVKKRENQCGKNDI